MIFFIGVDLRMGLCSAGQFRVESTGNARYFKNQAEKAGMEETVINTLKFKVINESTKKTETDI